jgi:ParB-like chromosome segregation protein Spo0J
MSAIVVRVLPIDQLIPADYNPRRPLTKPAYRKLRASVERFGLVEPLVWNERTGRVVGGHARLAVVRELGHTAVPVSVVNLSDAEERALNVVLNNQEAQGRYDPAKLADVLAGLQGLPEMEFTGFDAGTLRTLTMEPAGGLPAEPEPTRVEVTLVVSPDRFDELSPRLDELVREFDLESHVRRV